MRRVRLSTVALVKHKVLHILNMCICSFRYPVWNAHAPYNIAICGLPGPAYFFHITPQWARFFFKKKIGTTLRLCWHRWFRNSILGKHALIWYNFNQLRNVRSYSLDQVTELICFDAEGGMTHVMNDCIV